MIARTVSSLRFFGFLFLIPALFFGCAVAPPVQEMSDARQAINAAKEAKADKYAPEPLRDAERHIEQATHDLENGAYDRARKAALTAKDRAMKARERALSVGEGM